MENTNLAVANNQNDIYDQSIIPANLVFIYSLFCVSFHSGCRNLGNTRHSNSSRGWQSDPAQLLRVIIFYRLEHEDGLDNANVQLH